MIRTRPRVATTAGVPVLAAALIASTPLSVPSSADGVDPRTRHASTDSAASVRLNGRHVVVPVAVSERLNLNDSDIAQGWRRFQTWADRTDVAPAALDRYASGGWVFTPVSTQPLSTSASNGYQRGYIRCKRRGETKYSYKAENAFGDTVHKVTGSLPFCVNSLKIIVVRHKAFRSHLKVSDWASRFVEYKRRTNHTQAHYVKWAGRKKGSVRGAARYEISLRSGMYWGGTHCPRIRIRGLGNTRVKVSGRATEGC